jgi:hypothetical protein
VKLLTEYEPDVLSSILINLGGGKKLPLTELIVNQEQAHEQLWNDNVLKDAGYFVYGKISRIIKRERVMYINFEESDTEIPFTIRVIKKPLKNEWL